MAFNSLKQTHEKLSKNPELSAHKKEVLDEFFRKTQYDSEIKEEYESLSEIASIKYYDSTSDYAIRVKDRETAMINVLNPEKDEDRISIFFEVKGLSEVLSNYLDNVWDEAVPLDQITEQKSSN